MNISLADSQFYSPGAPKILLGSEIFVQVMGGMKYYLILPSIRFRYSVRLRKIIDICCKTVSEARNGTSGKNLFS